MRRLKEGLHKWRRERSPFGVQERGCVLFVGTGLCCINVRERECVLFLGVVQHFFLVWKRGSALFLGSQPMLVVQAYWYLLWLLLVVATLYLLGGNRL